MRLSRHAVLNFKWRVSLTRRLRVKRRLALALSFIGELSVPFADSSRVDEINGAGRGAVGDFLLQALVLRDVTQVADAFHYSYVLYSIPFSLYPGDFLLVHRD